ncbi:hypothetical protein GCM10010191_10350 [Actinomadura vinacea]|uniref:Knr4/Smi1-like domain-containing protein n=1 Tax=Actinomadura vinacea TaxID=115336 RepID=A0ABN3IIT1_9ACTN
MFDADHVRLGRIADKLAAARAVPVPPRAFGVEEHRFELGPPLPEAMAAEFEERHEVALPAAYRLFVTELGDGGAGPGYGLCRLSTSCCAHRRSGHLAQPSPYLPGPRYPGDWEQRYEDPPGSDRIFLRGTLEIAHHGCSLVTRLIVTGSARGRLLNLDQEGPVGPYVVEDADFLAWYERWLDEAIAGYDIGWFGERLPLDEHALIAVLSNDPSPARRSRAGESLLQLPVLSDSSWSSLVGTMTTDVHATVRAVLWDLLRWQRHQHQRRLNNAEAIADDVAQYARSCTPPDLEALSVLRRLTFTDILPELACHDLERRQRAAYHLIGQPWEFEQADLLDDVARRLLDDADPLLRSQGIAVVSRFGLVSLHPRLRELQKSETDPWVQHHLGWYPREQPTHSWDDSLTPAEREWTEHPPF